MRKGVLAAGIGWIAAGVLSLAVWYLLNASRLCSCPEIPTGAPQNVQCCISNNSDLYTGAIAIAVGVFILALGERISGEIEKRLLGRAKPR